jgi:hypothetical protein
MKIIKKIFPGVVLIALCSACSNEQKTTTLQDSMGTDSTTSSLADTLKTSENLLLIPGKSAGKVGIGQNAEEVYASLGKADAGDAAMQKSVAIWYKDHDPKSYATSIYTVRDTGDNPAARIQQVRVTSPEFKTKENISVGSTLDEIQKTYQVTKLADVTNAGAVLEMYDSLTGIAFETDVKGICKAIIIHKEKEGLKPTSLPLR